MIESIKLTNGKEIKLVQYCPECGGTIYKAEGSYYRCKECETLIDLCGESINKHITPAQFEEEAGIPLPDWFPVWAFSEQWRQWFLVKSFERSEWMQVLALNPAPDKDWRPEDND